MVKPYVQDTASFEDWRLHNNILSDKIGDLGNIYNVALTDVVLVANDLNTNKVNKSGDTITGSLSINNTLNVLNGTTLQSSLSVGGNTSLSGTLGVTLTSTFTGQLNANGNIVLGSNAITLNSTTGDTLIGGTLNVSGVSTLGIMSAATTTLTSLLVTTGGVTIQSALTSNSNITAPIFIGALQGNSDSSTTTANINGVTLSPNKFVSMNNTGNAFVEKSLNAGVGITLTHTASAATIRASYGDNSLVLDATNTTNTITPNQSIYTIPKATYRSACFNIQAVDSTGNYQIQSLNVIHNGTLVESVSYGSTVIGNLVATFSADISGANIRLLVTPESTNVTTYKINLVAINV